MPKRKKSSEAAQESDDDDEEEGTISLPRALMPGMTNQSSIGSFMPQFQQPPPNDFLLSSLGTPMMGADLRRQFFSASSFNPLYNLPPPPLYPSLNEQILAMQLRQRIASHDALLANSGLSNMYPNQNVASAPNLGTQSTTPAERLSLSSGAAARSGSDPFFAASKQDLPLGKSNDSFDQADSDDSGTDDDVQVEKGEGEVYLDDDRKRAATEPFPEKLHKLLREVEEEGKSDIISFTPDGRAFMIHKPEEFFADIVPKYFKQSRLSSFKRQLNLYGFEMITSGSLKGAFFHEHFTKDKPDLCRKLRRRDVKFISRPKHSQGFDASAPDFYSMPPITSSEEAKALAEARDRKAFAKSKDDQSKREKVSKRKR